MRSIVLICLALVIIILAVYTQSGNHQFVNLDDYAYVTDNPHVASGVTGKNIIWAFTSVYQGNWHPLTWLSHMADVQFFGMNPRGHHLTNVAIHAASSLLLLLLLLRLTGALWPSAFVAFLFALHPLHVESVAWVAERKDVLSAFFWFLTLLSYAGYVARPKPGAYLLALISFVLGLMAKPMLVTLPVVMLLFDYWPLDRYRQEGPERPRRLSGRAKRLVKEKIPFFAASFLSAVVTIYAQHKGGAVMGLYGMPVRLRIENALIAYVKYIGKTLWPHDLAVLYPIPSAFPLWQVSGAVLVLLLVSAAAIRAGGRHPYLAVGWCWFVVTLVPVIGLIQVGSQSMADRYTYIPTIGLFIMAAWGGPELARKVPHRQGLLALLAGAVLTVSAALTWQQLGYWRDSISLFRHTLRVTTGNSSIHCNLGLALARSGDLDAAIREYREALRISPHYANAHNNLGLALAKKGEFDAAIEHFLEALRINPDYPDAHINLGNALAKRGEFDAAIREYRQALRINPDELRAHNNLGAALANKGNVDAAILEYRQTLRINPDYWEAHTNLGNALAIKGDLDAAIQEYRKALRINPHDMKTHDNMGIALGQKRMKDEIRKE